jgi:hypothetical protein
MSQSRTTEILEAWRSVADSAALPAEAPRQSRSVLPMGIAGAAVAVAVVLVALLVRGGSTPGVPIGGAISSSPSASPSATVRAVTPSPTAVASPVALPNPGGTCSASQIVVGKATYSYGYGTIGTTSVYVTLPLRNVGGDCVLHLPAVIGVAPATGPFEAVSVEDNGTESATGENSPAQSVRILSGRSLSIVLGAWWRIDTLRPENGTPFPAPPCLNPISDVTRVAFPFATGRIQIDLPTVFNQICSSPASMSLTIKSR